ncbi:HI0933-like protein [Seminavis robusta]|uniref:HI0933-like protein n=1 Tax=Seminavis robusta TaxID=568900 RepID=A0A9N8DUA4_9STRA|nr:HI0933-like protein [Seminavis robusta]|eukprot:Sro285_g108070.1 HI0933-like protein (655) ;mRNA; r:7442-9406
MRQRYRQMLLPRIILLLALFECCHSFLSTSSKSARAPRSLLYAEQRPVIAVVGGDLAGVVSACTIAQHQQQQKHQPAQVWLLTGHAQILEGLVATAPILPDLTLDNRQLIERFGSGGRELAGILAKQCTPLKAKEWLEEQGVVLQEAGDATGTATLVGETALNVHPKCDLRQKLMDTLDTCQVKVETNVKVASISYNKPGFTITRGDQGSNLEVDVVVLAGDYQEVPNTPIYATTGKGSTTSATSSKKKTIDLDSLLAEIEDEPMSLKDQMKLEEKRKGDAKKKKMDSLIHASGGSADMESLSKQEQRTLAKKRKKEAKIQKQQLKQSKKGPSAGSTSSRELSDDRDEYSPDKEEDSEELPAIDKTTRSTAAINALELATGLGHATTKESIGMFSFMFPTRGILEGCAKAIVPKARLRCRLDNNSAKGPNRLPKWEGPLLVSQGEIAGPAAWRLSTLIAQDMAAAGNQGTVQIHFAPDIGGVEEVEAALIESANPVASVLKAPCPLLHREIDYDDYDMETGDFKSIEFPLVPKRLWGNLCRQAGITTNKLKWKDLPPANVQALARLLVDSSLPITGIRPHDNVWAGGVSLKDINMAECQSQNIKGLFLCGSAIDVHGFNGGFNALACVATGFVAASHIMKLVGEDENEGDGSQQ